ncbi:MAG: flagellar motor protein MotB, partial [Bacteroidota bacterium]
MEDLDSNAQVHANSLKRKSCFLLSILVACYCLSGQPPKSTDRKAQKFYDKAVAAQKERNFGEAIQLLKKAVKRDLTFSGAIVKIGNLYMRLGNDDSSYHYYKVYCSATSNPALSILETCALMSFDRGLYEEASAFLNRLRARDSSLVEREDLFLLQQSLAFAAEQLTNPDSINFEELPTSVNGFKLQYLPAITADGAQLFYTKRDQVSGDEDIVVSHRDGNTWTEARSVSNRINTPLNEGACTISADGRKMIFTSCDRRDAFGSCDLYISTKKGKYWSKPRNLGKPVNTKYWESQPALSADGRTLYFSSLRPEGKGARDIWVSSQIDGKWSKPKNLSRINTAKDETTPYIHSNGTSLFFSSNGYPGMGGFDLYIWNLADTAATPSNLGYPINSFRDEVALITASNGTDAYLAKEELKNKQILESKIYKLTFPEENRTPPAYYVKGIVLDKQKRTPMKALVEVYDLEIGERLFAAKSDSITGSYFFVLPTDRKIGAYVKKEGFLFKDFSFDV